MTTLPVTLLNAPESRRKRALWACAMYDAGNGNTKALQRFVADGPIPKEHRAAVAALLAQVPGRTLLLSSADVIAIHDFRNTTAKDWPLKRIKHHLADQYPAVGVETIYDVLVCRKTFAWVRALRYRTATSTATIPFGGTAAGTVKGRR